MYFLPRPTTPLCERWSGVTTTLGWWPATTAATSSTGNSTWTTSRCSRHTRSQSETSRSHQQTPNSPHAQTTAQSGYGTFTREYYTSSELNWCDFVKKSRRNSHNFGKKSKNSRKKLKLSEFWSSPSLQTQEHSLKKVASSGGCQFQEISPVLP